MLHDNLTPLLLMREELQPVPQSAVTEKRLNSRTTIANSPLYEEAVARFYLGAETHGHHSPSPIPQTHVLPTPPQTQQRLRPFRSLKHPPAPDGSSVTPPRYILEQRRSSAPGASVSRMPISRDPGLDDEGPNGASETEVIEITDSEPEEDESKIPILIVLWTMVRLSSSCQS